MFFYLNIGVNAHLLSETTNICRIYCSCANTCALLLELHFFVNLIYELSTFDEVVLDWACFFILSEISCCVLNFMISEIFILRLFWPISLFEDLVPVQFVIFC